MELMEYLHIHIYEREKIVKIINLYGQMKYRYRTRFKQRLIDCESITATIVFLPNHRSQLLLPPQ